MLKQIGAAVFATITEATSASGFSSAPYIGTLENDGVGLAGITGDFADLIAGIISGDITTK